MATTGNTPLLPEETEVQKIIDDTNKQMDVINQQLNNLLPDKPRSYELRPPGTPPSNFSRTKAAHEKYYLDKLVTIKSNAVDRMLHVIKDKPYETQATVYQRIHNWVYPDKGNEPNKHRKDRRDIAESQDVSMKLWADKFSKPSKSIEPAKTSPAADNPDKKITPPLFSSTLKYKQTLEHPDISPDKLRNDRNRDRDRDIEPER